MLSIIFFIHTFFSFITTKYFVSLAPFHFNSLFGDVFGRRVLVATAVLVSQLDGVVQPHLVGEVLEVLVHR